jgi:hypothetical protein
MRGAHLPCALPRGAWAGGPRGKSERGNHRQLKRKKGQKGGFDGPARLDAAKKVTSRKQLVLVDTVDIC